MSPRLSDAGPTGYRSMPAGPTEARARISGLTIKIYGCSWLQWSRDHEY